MATATKNWYVLRVASNREDQVRDALERKVKIEGLEDLIGRIIVPTERIKRVKQGQQKVAERKLYPGYVFVEVEVKKGDPIKIKEGPFENFEGTVDEIFPDKGVVRVIVTIFGRATPLELEYWQLEKVDAT